MLKENIEKVLENFDKAKKEKFAAHPIAAHLRRDFPNELKDLTSQQDKYKFVGSAGRGNWTFTPWVAVLNLKITDSVRKGFYVVYLFRGDSKGVYLSINQGTIKLLNEKGDIQTEQILKSKADQLRKRLDKKFPELTKSLLKEIDLGEIQARYGTFYEAGNVYAKYYSLENMPSNKELTEDFKEFMELYDSISSRK